MTWNQSEKLQLVDHIAELADYYGARPPSDKAMDLWVRSLANDSPASVLSILEDWPKFNSKMPTIAEVRQKAQERFSKRLEAHTEEMAQTDRSFDARNVRPADPYVLRAVERYLAARRAVPHRSQDFALKLALMHYVTNRPARNPRWVHDSNPPLRRLGAMTIQKVVAAYGIEPDPAVVEQVRQEVNAQLAAERSVPGFLVFLAEERGGNTAAAPEDETPI